MPYVLPEGNNPPSKTSQRRATFRGEVYKKGCLIVEPRGQGDFSGKKASEAVGTLLE